VAEDRYAERAARVLLAVRGRIEPGPHPDPQASIAALEEAIVSVVRRRRRRRIAAVSALAVFAAVLPIFVHRSKAPVATAPSASSHWAMIVEGRGAGRLLGGGETRPVLPGDQLAAGAVVETGETELTLLSSDGTRLQVAPHSELRFTRADVIRWFRLSRGAVSLAVAKLPSGERFVVETPDRQVEVKGTRFAVHLAPSDGCAAGTVTRVTVEEGTVVVRENGGPDEVIRKGAHWPAGCSVLEAPSSAQISPRHERPTPARHASPPARTAEPPASTLAEENDLFSSAVRAARAGDRAAALTTLDELIRRYPSSPLRAAAIEERLKITGPITNQ
jgi:ferric-dicitrate binding protein FerR (iron transport regulator)